MQEGQGNIEQEIAELNRQINDKRAQLERERGGSVESREVIHNVVGEKVFGHPSPSSSAQPITHNPTPIPSRSYLDNLSTEEVGKINSLIDQIPHIGLNKIIERAKNEIPFILDAFHDALVDRLHSHLKSQNLI